MRSSGAHRLNLHALRVSPPMLRSIVKIGMPIEIQSALTSFSNVFVQSYINSFGSACMAGWSAFLRKARPACAFTHAIDFHGVDDLRRPEFSARDLTRAKSGIRVAILMSTISTAVLMLPLMLRGRWAFSTATRRCWRSGGCSSSGCRRSTCSLASTTSSRARCAARAIRPDVHHACLLRRHPADLPLFCLRAAASVLPIALGYPIGWILCAALQFAYYKLSGWENGGARTCAIKAARPNAERVAPFSANLRTEAH